MQAICLGLWLKNGIERKQKLNAPGKKSITGLKAGTQTCEL